MAHSLHDLTAKRTSGMLIPRKMLGTKKDLSFQAKQTTVGIPATLPDIQKAQRIYHH
jgi:hypothetical protein